MARSAILAAAGLACLTAVSALAAEARLVLLNGRVYTMDAARSWAEAVAVVEGKITFVGASAEAEARAGPGARRVDLGGRMVLPGFQDSHVHLISGGMVEPACDLASARTRAELEQQVLTCAIAPGPWVVGRGWELPLFPAAHPRKELLDALVPDRPALFSAADGHSGWANSRALAAAGITRETPDPPKGRIERDPTSGEPTGTLREAATDLVRAKVPAATTADYVRGLRRGMAEANRLGITSIQEASADEPRLRAYAELAKARALTLRVVAALRTDPKRDEAQVDDLIRLRAVYSGARLRPIAAKIFADGVIESRTAALLQPYLDAPQERGLANFEPQALERLVGRLDKEGFQVHTHAIGDRAIRMTLDAYQAARRANRRRDARHQIAHLQLIDPADVPRFHELDVIANFQALWAQADEYITELTEPKLGEQRSRWLYPIASVAHSGALVAGGSDWPVSSLDPLSAIELGVTRRRLGDANGQSWIPEQRVDLGTMIAAYTSVGAYANRQERTTGSIEVGKAADLIVLEHDLFALSPDQIHSARVLWTLLDGGEVYRDPAWTPYR